MSEAVLVAEHVSKRYCRGLRRSLLYGVADIGRELTGRGQAAEGLRPGEFWALRDVSFSVAQGESLGLIGHNGAGKTTLLKLINGLIKPNGGRISVRGSVRALIALGAGFNPILTGRENIKVSCAVLGYSDAEIAERFDAIVDFSEIGDAIDAPVQSYSSGMVARLGFSVAIHTQPDLLLIDEVLAVGDLNFAIKCYRRISELRAAGVAFVIVNHNPYAIRTNCDRALWVEGGVMQDIGDANAICDAYERYVAQRDVTAVRQEYLDANIQDLRIEGPAFIQTGGMARFSISFSTRRRLDRAIATLSLFNINGQNVVSAVSADASAELHLEVGRHTMNIEFSSLPLSAGRYRVNFVLAEREMNNQLAALLNCHDLEIGSVGNRYAVGIVQLSPTWQIVSRDI